jgi:hypothetical protein
MENKNNLENKVGYRTTSFLEKELKDYINLHTIEVNGKYKYIGKSVYLEAYKSIKEYNDIGRKEK